MINVEWSWRAPIINKLLEKAAIKLGELNSFARLVPNIDLFIQLRRNQKRQSFPAGLKEPEQIWMKPWHPIEEIKPERQDDWLEVKKII
ncbi:MAG: hypothetical protein MZV63_42995 [Marinilabiliales bacterium]|nr:hypothetical protein [Marinilabiliales bacterium]